jgi:3-hydroxybutyrate dehydrogenase
MGENKPLVGQKALVTGANSGIGKAVAIALGDAGADVVVNYRDGEDKAVEVAEQIARAGSRVLAIRADVSVETEVSEMFRRAIDQFGTIDILVNNAGLQHVSPVEEFPEDRWEQMIRIMLVGPFLLTKYALPLMYARKWGRIINVSSLHGLVASPYKSAYISAKHGLMGLTKTVALEAADKGVTVNAICPSYVRTPLVDRQIDDLAKENRLSREQVVEQIMLAPAAIKRLLEPSEVAALATFLCSDAASGITGSAQAIDCGWTAR